MFVVRYGCSWNFGGKNSCVDPTKHNCDNCKYTFYNPWHKNPENIYKSKEELIKHLQHLHFQPERNGMNLEEYMFKYYHYGRNYTDNTIDTNIRDAVIQEKNKYIKDFTDNMELNNLYHSDHLMLNTDCCDIIIYYTDTLSKPIFLSYNDIYK